MLTLTAAVLAVAGVATPLDFKVEPFKDQCSLDMDSLNPVYGKQLGVGLQYHGFSLWGEHGQLVAAVMDKNVNSNGQYYGAVGDRLLFRGYSITGNDNLVGYDIRNPAQPVRAFVKNGVLAGSSFTAVAGDHLYSLNGSTLSQYDGDGGLTAQGELGVKKVLEVFAFRSVPGVTYAVAQDGQEDVNTLYAFNTSTGAVRVVQRQFLQGNGDLMNAVPFTPDAVVLGFSKVLNTLITLGPDLQPVTTFQFTQDCELSTLVVDQAYSEVNQVYVISGEYGIYIITGLDTPHPEVRGVLDVSIDTSGFSIYAVRGAIVSELGVITVGSGPSMTGYVAPVSSRIDPLPYKAPSDDGNVFSLGGGMCLVGKTLLHPDGRATPTDQEYTNYLGSIGGQFYFSSTFRTSQPSVVVCDKALNHVKSFSVGSQSVDGGRTLGSFVYVWSVTSSDGNQTTNIRQYSLDGDFTGVAWGIEEFRAFDMFAFSTVPDAVYTCSTNTTDCYKINTATGAKQQVTLPLPTQLTLAIGVVQLTDDLVVLVAECEDEHTGTLYTLGPSLELVNSYMLPDGSMIAVDQSFSEVDQVYVIRRSDGDVVIVKGLNTTQPTGQGRVIMHTNDVCANRGAMISVGWGQVNNVTVGTGHLPPLLDFETEVLMELGRQSGPLCPLTGGMGLLTGVGAENRAIIVAGGQVIWTSNGDYTDCNTGNPGMAYVQSTSSWSALNVSAPRKTVTVGVIPNDDTQTKLFFAAGGYCYSIGSDRNVRQYTADGVDTGVKANFFPSYQPYSCYAFSFKAVPLMVYFAFQSSVTVLDTKSGASRQFHLFNDGTTTQQVVGLPGDLQVFAQTQVNFGGLFVVDKDFNIVSSLRFPAVCALTSATTQQAVMLQVDQAYDTVPQVYVSCNSGTVLIARNLHTPQAAWVGFVDLGAGVLRNFYAYNGSLVALASGQGFSELLRITPVTSPVPPTVAPPGPIVPSPKPAPSPGPTPAPVSGKGSRSGLSVGAWLGICAGAVVASGLVGFIKGKRLATPERLPPAQNLPLANDFAVAN